MNQPAKHPSGSSFEISVIIPTWNEEASIARCLRSVGHERPGIQVIVVDGGSTDRTVEIAAASGVTVVHCPERQRAVQLDMAVQHARGRTLLFLHADTLLPPTWLENIRRAMNGDPGCVGGAFKREFDHPSLWLRMTCVLAGLRGRLFGFFLGDQAMFVRASEFWRLGGFRPFPSCEDLDFSVRLAKVGRTHLVEQPVLSSGRRFLARGPVAQTLVDLSMAVRFLFSRTASPADVAPDKTREAEPGHPEPGLRFAQSPFPATVPDVRRINPHTPPFPT